MQGNNGNIMQALRTTDPFFCFKENHIAVLVFLAIISAESF